MCTLSDRACDYTIVVPAYNEADALPRTLRFHRDVVESISDYRGEIVVVDNNCTDDTAAIAESLGARVVFEPVNQISRARNRGAEVARGRYLIFVDADTTAPRVLIEAALAALASGRTCGGGTLVGTTEEVHPTIQRTIRLWNYLSQRRRWAAGSFVYCLRDGWEAVGGFSLEVYAAEEIYFSEALRRWGRARRLDFRILPHPVDTSMRKVRWYSPWKLLWVMLRSVFCPWLLRSRRFCGAWYDRPATP